jgi:RNA polymerase sigma factor (sigma-70 family)
MNPNFSANAQRDAKLVVAVRTGDDKAFKQLMNCYTDVIYFMILKIVNIKPLAKELTIEAFEKAYINLHQYEPLFAFSSWLFSIAHNHTIDHLRKKKINDGFFINTAVEYNGLELQAQEKVSSSLDNPEEALIRLENARLVRKFVSDLKPQYRVLLEMRYFEEYSYSEIASELNLPLGTIKVQLFRSRKLLYELLKNSEICFV